MSIRRFFDQNVVVRRLKTSVGRRKSFQSTATVEGHIQGLDDEARQRLGIIEEKGWKAWFAVDADVNEGDEILGDDGKTYEVREVVIKDYGTNQHKEVILMEKEP